MVIKIFWVWLTIVIDRVYGSFIAENGVGTTGIVVRDLLSQIIVAALNILPRCSSTEEAEALAFIGRTAP
jgi:hypothetical protein